MTFRTLGLLIRLGHATLGIALLAQAAGAAIPYEWSVLPPPAPPAQVSGRHGHSAIVDPVRQRMVVFGGYLSGAAAALSNLEVLPLNVDPRWEALAAAGGPAARFGHSAILDGPRDRMIVFGGTGAQSFGDVWALALGAPAEWTQLAPAGPPPSARFGHSAIYDPVRQRMIVFGGFDAEGNYRSDVWALSLTGTPTWSPLAPAGDSPGARDYHVAIYDPPRDRMLIYGGNASGGTLGDVWALSLGGAPAWTELAPAGPAPSSRLTPCAAYESLGDRMVVFGGWNAPAGALGDVWQLSLSGTPAWSPRVPTGVAIAPRFSASMVADVSSQRLVVFGGFTYSGSTSQTLALGVAGGFNWSVIEPAPALPARFGHSVVVDATRGRALLFGGSTWTNQTLVWSLQLSPSGTAWRPVPGPGNAPGPRYGHTAVVDVVRDRMLLCGGFDGAYLNDLWSLDLGMLNWTPIAVAGTPPMARDFHVAAIDPSRHRMLVFGGNAEGTYLNDLWQVELSGPPVWTQLTPSGSPPVPRLAHAMVYDASHDRMIVFGGYGWPPGHRADLWALRLSPSLAWEPLVAGGVPPAARYGHTMVMDEVTGRALVVGGESFGYSLNDVWELQIDPGPLWLPVAASGGPLPARHGHASFYDPFGHRLVVNAGALSGGAAWNDTWFLGLATPPTPALMSLSASEVTSQRVRLTWYSPDPPAAPCAVVRRAGNGDWVEMERRSFVGGLLTHEDRSVVPGSRYAYALHEAGEKEPRAAVEIEVPRGDALALVGSAGGIAEGPLRIRFVLPDARPAKLEVFDAAGRRTTTREVGMLGVGVHEIQMENLQPGLYWVRLSNGQQRVQARVIRLR